MKPVRAGFAALPSLAALAALCIFTFGLAGCAPQPVQQPTPESPVVDLQPATPQPTTEPSTSPTTQPATSQAAVVVTPPAPPAPAPPAPAAKPTPAQVADGIATWIGHNWGWILAALTATGVISNGTTGAVSKMGTAVLTAYQGMKAGAAPNLQNTSALAAQLLSAAAQLDPKDAGKIQQFQYVAQALSSLPAAPTPPKA